MTFPDEWGPIIERDGQRMIDIFQKNNIGIKRLYVDEFTGGQWPAIRAECASGKHIIIRTMQTSTPGAICKSIREQYLMLHPDTPILDVSKIVTNKPSIGQNPSFVEAVMRSRDAVMRLFKDAGVPVEDILITDNGMSLRPTVKVVFEKYQPYFRELGEMNEKTDFKSVFTNVCEFWRMMNNAFETAAPSAIVKEAMLAIMNAPSLSVLPESAKAAFEPRRKRVFDL